MTTPGKNDLPESHTAAFWAAKPRRLEPFVVAKVADNGGDYVSLTSTNSWGFGVAKATLGRDIQVGEHLEQETVNFNHITGLRDENGWLYRLSNQDLADQVREHAEKWHREKVVRLEQNRQKWAAEEEALPDWLKARIQRYRDAGGEHFLLEGWGYELIICNLVVLMEDQGEEAAQEYGDKEGCSGNQWGCAEALVKGHALHGDEFGAKFPAGLTPLMDSADYSK